jgi:hypothetical protein
MFGMVTDNMGVSPLARNRKFESISLQRRVECEPAQVQRLSRRAVAGRSWSFSGNSADLIAFAGSWWLRLLRRISPQTE